MLAHYFCPDNPDNVKIWLEILQFKINVSRLMNLLNVPKKKNLKKNPVKLSVFFFIVLKNSPVAFVPDKKWTFLPSSAAG